MKERCYWLWDLERVFGIGPFYAIAELRAGRLRGRKVAGTWLVTLADLAAWRGG